MNRRAKGNRNESRSADYYNKRGYYTITSRASAGILDVACIYVGEPDPLKPHTIWVQTKTGGSYGKSDIAQLRMFRKQIFANGINGIVVLHNWKPNKRQPDILLVGDSPEDDVWIAE